MFGKKEVKVYHCYPGTYAFPMPFLVWQQVAMCHVEIIVEDSFHASITVTHDDIAKGSITNNFERIATSIQKLFFKQLGVLPEHVSWIEVYPPGVVEEKESRRAVTMHWNEKQGIYASPGWRSVETD